MNAHVLLNLFDEFFTISLSNTWNPQSGAIFCPRGIVRTTLIVVHYVMLHAKYQGSMPCSFR